LREGRPLSRGSWIVMIGFALILGPLMLVALGLSLAALAMMMMLDIILMCLMLIIADKALTLLFRYAPVAWRKLEPVLARAWHRT
jgi:hypothetical protein